MVFEDSFFSVTLRPSTGWVGGGRAGKRSHIYLTSKLHLHQGEANLPAPGRSYELFINSIMRRGSDSTCDRDGEARNCTQLSAFTYLCSEFKMPFMPSTKVLLLTK